MIRKARLYAELVGIYWWRCPDSNRGHCGYEAPKVKFNESGEIEITFKIKIVDVMARLRK